MKQEPRLWLPDRRISRSANRIQQHARSCPASTAIRNGETCDCFSATDPAALDSL